MDNKTIRIIKRGGSEYPPELENIHDPPMVLHVNGEPLDNLIPRVAIVGSRKCSAYGRAIAEELAEDLSAEGVTIVSGLARGIDTAAHRGALRHGRTIGILGCGADQVYPPENHELYKEIPHAGAIISEYPNGTAPLPRNFPARNRIISGISLGVVIVEAALQSGALITADLALEQGREVMVVPGHAKSPTSQGCHRLLKAGAALVDSAADIMEVLGFDLENQISRPGVVLSDDEVQLLELIDFEPTVIDAIAGRSTETIAKVAGILLQLEIKGYLRKGVGGQVTRLK